MRYLKLFESFDAFNNTLDMKHFEEFFSEEELKSMIDNLEDILIELTDMNYQYEYIVDDFDYMFKIIIRPESISEKIDTKDIDDVLYRAKDFMSENWDVSIGGKFIYKNLLLFGTINKLDNELYIEPQKVISGLFIKDESTQINGKFKIPLKDVNELYEIVINFYITKPT